MRWRFGRLGRIFRRVWRLMLLTQAVSPLIAGLAILSASAFGIDLDKQNAADLTTGLSEDIDPTSLLSPSKLELIDSDISASSLPTDTCCQLDSYRPCPRPTSKASSESCFPDTPILPPCSNLSLECLTCNCDYSCQYGKPSLANCTAISGVKCEGPRTFLREFTCSYCYLSLNPVCSTNLAASCRSNAPVTQRSHWYVASCNTRKNVLCLGSSRFSKRLECSWTEGYSWKTALVLSVTLGGFGADRFYLGDWQVGIGKLFTFGGLGVWTLVDVVLVAIRYIGPADGSLYI